MEASINVTLNIENEKYIIDLGIPSGKPANDKPYKFSVSSNGANTTNHKLLELAVGGGENFYVNLAPPDTVLPGNTVEDLSVNVHEGNYDGNEFSNS